MVHGKKDLGENDSTKHAVLCTGGDCIRFAGDDLCLEYLGIRHPTDRPGKGENNGEFYPEIGKEKVTDRKEGRRATSKFLTYH